MGKPIKVENVTLTENHLLLLREIYLNVMASPVLTVEIAANRNLGIDEVFMECADKVANISKRLDKMGRPTNLYEVKPIYDPRNWIEKTG